MVDWEWYFKRNIKWKHIKTLTESQLNSDIVILQDGQLINTDVLDVVVDDNPLYEFKDVDMTTYLDFEDDISASEYTCSKVLD